MLAVRMIRVCVRPRLGEVLVGEVLGRTPRCGAGAQFMQAWGQAAENRMIGLIVLPDLLSASASGRWSIS